jgi:biopolymer transport protein ExbB
VLYAGLTAKTACREDVEAAILVRSEKEIANLERNLRILEVIVTISPLLGLLGTVMGIIRSFNVLVMTQGVADPRALGAGISEALFTTAIGLIIAIPSFVMHSWFNSRVDRFVLDMNEAAVELVEILERRGDWREISAKK